MIDENEFEEDSSPTPIHRKVYNWIKFTSVEPSMFLYYLAFAITQVVEQSLFFNKACTVDHGFSNEKCAKKNVSMEELLQIQITVTKFQQLNGIAAGFVPITLALYLGNWSDRRGRKIPLLLGLFSKFFYSLMMIINSIQSTWSLYAIIYSATFPTAIFGGELAISISSFAYIADISSDKRRTLRISILNFVYLSAIPIGLAIGSVLFNKVVNKSYPIMFGINATLMLLSIVYSYLNLKSQTAAHQKPLKDKNILVDFFDNKHVIETFNTLKKERPGFGRLHVWLILFCTIFNVFQKDENSRLYLYTLLMFNWEVSQYSHFVTFRSGFYLIAMVVAIPIFAKKLQGKDTSIIVVGAMSRAFQRIFYFFATIPELFYSGAAIGVLGTAVSPVLKSMTSKFVEKQEKGKIFTLLSVFDKATSIISTVIYGQLYNYTVDTVPGAIFWFTFSTQIMLITLILIIQFTRNTIDDIESYEIQNNK